MKLEEDGIANTSTDGGSSSISAAAPENVIDVVNQDEHIKLKERLQAREQLNDILFKAIDNKSLKESETILTSLTENKKPWENINIKDASRMERYTLQKWTNGGGGDGSKKGEPSEYEKWREKLNLKNKEVRTKQEIFDRTAPFKEPYQYWNSLDSQEDAFLKWWQEEYGNV